MKTLVTARLLPTQIASLEEMGLVVTSSGYGALGRKLSEEELIAALVGVEIAIVEFEPLNARVLESAKDLKLIAACRNEPAANVDLEYATDKGIPVIFTPGRNANAVAEYTIGLALSVARNISAAHHFLRYTDELTAVTYGDKSGERKSITSEWSLEPGAPFQRFQGVELSGKTLGLIGFGAIGQSIAKLAAAFGMEIIAYDPFQSSEVFESLSATEGTLEVVARNSDFIAMAAKVTPETTGIFSAELIAMMKPGAFFINTARAALVDYNALLRALQERKIQGAALDVYPNEPLENNSLFRTLDNVLLSPHLAGATFDVIRHHGEMVLNDLQEIINGRIPRRAANPRIFDDFFSRGGLK